MQTVKFLGTTDEVTTCDCCGRQNLKNTVALEIDESDPVYYGVTCAAHALTRAPKDILSESRKADRAREAHEQAIRDAKYRTEFNAWDAWLSANSTGADTFMRIQNLGGYPKARAMYEASK